MVAFPHCGCLTSVPRLIPWEKATIGGTMAGKVSLHDPQTNKRLTQTANVADCQPIKLLRLRTRLVPLVPLPTSPAPKKEGLLPPRHTMRAVSANRVQ